MELWDVYDKDKQFTGKVVQRSFNQPLDQGEYGLAVRAIIFNDNNEILIQKRQSTKELFPNLWDLSCGGHVLSGESNRDAISRELSEELGLDLDFSDDAPVITLTTPHHIDDYYFVQGIDIDINNLKLATDEVQSVTWASKEEILQLISERKFINFSKGFIEFLFFLNENEGDLIGQLEQ